MQSGRLDLGERVMQLSANLARGGVALLAVIACVAACNSSPTSFGFPSAGSGEAFATPSPPPGPPSSATSFPQAPVCPVPQPLNGESCFAAGPSFDTCEYGGAVDPSCNVIARCIVENGSWSVEQPTHCPTTCPDHFDERAPGETCSGTELCTYLEATCGCAGAIDGAWTNITGGSNNTVSDAGAEASADAGPAAIGRWQCIRPVNGCPVRRPLLGTRCTKAIDCDYGTCAFGVPLSMTCINGLWTALYVGSCP
jgi:hypothetical protein